MYRIAATLLFFAAATPVSGKDLCSRAGDTPCVSTTRGAVIALDLAEAERIAPFASRGEQRFIDLFGAEPPTYAVASGVGARAATPLFETLGVAGAGFAWPTAQQRVDSIRESTRRMAEQAAAQQGLSTEQSQAAVERALTQIHATIEGEARGDAATVPHELGHIWFIRTFWPDSGGGGHYGGPAPDWFDEGAAMLLEDEFFTGIRQAGFRKFRDEGGLTPLPEFLAGEHPARKLDSAAVRGRQTLTDAELEELGVNAAAIPLFYNQSRVFMDFLVAHANGGLILRDLARGLAAGQTFEAWLAARGADYGLGGTVDALNARWLSWIADF